MNDRDPVILAEPDNGLQLVRWKVDGFFALRSKGLLDPRSDFELVDGLVLLREHGGPLHDALVAELAERLRASFGETGVLVDHELCLEDEEAVVTPDIVVGRQLVIEVSVDGSRLDATEKARLYARAGFETYWQLDLAWGLFYTHRLPHRDGFGMRHCGPHDRPVWTGVPECDEWRYDELLSAARDRVRPLGAPA